MSFDAHQMDSVLLLGVVMLAAILAVRVSVGMGLPSLLLYLLMGVLLGEAGLGIEFEDANVAHALGFAALVLILAEGGLTTQWAEIRPVMKHGVALATVGVGSQRHRDGGRRALPLRPRLAARGAPRGGHVADRRRGRCSPCCAGLRCRGLTGVLEAESGLNDDPTVLLVTLVSTGAALDHGVIGFVGIVLYELALGGRRAARRVRRAWVMRRVALPSSGLYPIAVLSPDHPGVPASPCTRRGSPPSTRRRSCSELGPPHRTATRSFSEAAWLAQIGVRDARPALVSPGRTRARGRRRARRAAAVVARPLSVFACSFVGRMACASSFVFLGRPARRRTHRAGHHPARRPSRSRPSCSTSCS